MSECHEAPIATTPTRKSIVAGYSVVISIVCGYAAQSINFAPRDSVTYLAIALAVSLSLIQILSLRKPNNANATHNLRHFGLFLVLCPVNVWMFAITLPYFASSLSARDSREIHTVLDANKSGSPLKCGFSVILDNLSAPLKAKICVSRSEWEKVKRGDRVTVVLTSSQFGQTVKELDLTTSQEH